MTRLRKNADGSYRVHDSLQNFHSVTHDNNIDPLSGLSRKKTDRDESLPPLGHRESIVGEVTQCGCKACQQRRTQDRHIRTLADLNQRHREIYGR